MRIRSQDQPDSQQVGDKAWGDRLVVPDNCTQDVQVSFPPEVIDPRRSAVLNGYPAVASQPLKCFTECRPGNTELNRQVSFPRQRGSGRELTL